MSELELREASLDNHVFESVNGVLSELPAGSSFVYGSHALCCLLNDSGIAGSRERCCCVDGQNFEYVIARDIDIAFIEGRVPDYKIWEIANAVCEVSEGSYRLDPHVIIVDDDQYLIKRYAIDPDYLSTILTVSGVEVLDPPSLLLMRALYGCIRPKDVNRIMLELSLVETPIFLESRCLMALNIMIQSVFENPSSLPINTLKYMIGLLPQDQQERYIRSLKKYRNFIRQRMGAKTTVNEVTPGINFL